MTFEKGALMSQEEKKILLNALKVIRTECKKHENCHDCPLCSDEGCKLKIDGPKNWVLANEKTQWKAFL